MSFLKNSFKKRVLKFSATTPEVCEAAVDVLNTKLSESVPDLYEVIPLNPRIQPVNVFVVTPV
ncbi:MAG: hypothetical protein ACXADL_16335 [Candidatus Thorarchaeota archaeon]